MLTDDSRRRLGAFPFFASLAPHELERLAAQAEVVSAASGEILLREGERGDQSWRDDPPRA